MAQLQPKWPLKIDPLHGPYASVQNVAESIHQDFLQLLKTIPGEWPGRPDLGIGLVKFLFEHPNSAEFNSVKSRIKAQVGKLERRLYVDNGSPSIQTRLDRHERFIKYANFISYAAITAVITILVRGELI